jgi:acyl-coenzyme A synthetase/AMP-(fatty) acid ligase
MDKMTVWFEEAVKEAAIEKKRHKEEQKALNVINARIESGEIIQQKAWQFIKELNSYSEDRLDSVAIIDGRTEYTYRLMFEKWERYAKVFSALGITGKDNSRAVLRSTPAAETVFALFALNMTGASVSLGLDQGANNIVRLRGLNENENLTDVILTDSNLDERYLRQVMKEKDSLGIRNVIVMHIPKMGKFALSREEKDGLLKYKRLKRIKGVLFMDDLLKKHKDAPVYFSEDMRDDAMITHTSGTTTGANKPVPMSDAGINETAARLLADDRFESLKGRASTLLLVELGSAYSLCNELLLPLAFGGRVAVLPPAGAAVLSIDSLRALTYYNVNVFFGGPTIMEMLMKIPLRPDLSDIEFVFLGGSYASVDARKRYNRYLKRCGSKARVSIGYGLSEAGGACMLSSPDREDDSIGWPLKGIKIRLYDEEKDVFYDPADGPATGIMYMSSPSVSCGCIDNTMFFELKNIEGEKYLNTYDLVRTDEDGAFFYCGRMNKYFVNNSSVRFDAGLVESAVSAQPKIESCGLVPGYDKILRDTIPVLYVKPTIPAEEAKNVVRNALIGAFITKGAIKDTNLPLECVITDDIKYNASGKVDVHQIATGDVEGYRYRVIPVRHGGKLMNIRLVKYRSGWGGERGLPEELDNNG